MCLPNDAVETVTCEVIDGDIKMFYKLIANSSSNNYKDLEMFQEVMRLQEELKKVGIIFKKEFRLELSKRHQFQSKSD